MKFYLAPMEGLTGYVYRNVHHSFFPQIDKYFSPFIAANQSERFTTRELKDVLPENNQGIPMVPQILTNQSADFLHTAKKLNQLGYNEINLNLGCPSGTVVAKNRGSGFLSQREALDAFLYDIFAQTNSKISIKTRLGKDHPDEFYSLIEIYNKYPLEELIIHPRIQKDFYKNSPNWKLFDEATALSKNPLCYNGDLFSITEYQSFATTFPQIDTVMIGRGIITNPGLIGEILGESRIDKLLLRKFHDTLYENYKIAIEGERNVLYKMKEVWLYMTNLLFEPSKYWKKIKKADRFKDYDEAVDGLFRDLEILS
jgi:tRNA-dihydrouridine synthase